MSHRAEADDYWVLVDRQLLAAERAELTTLRTHLAEVTAERDRLREAVKAARKWCYEGWPYRDDLFPILDAALKEEPCPR